MIVSALILAILGFAISFYTFTIERKIKQDPDFKPVCDLSDKISCTKPMKSEYAHLFYFSNATAGMLFYTVTGALALAHAHAILLVTITGACIASCVLAYILYAKVHAFCLLCTALYVINFMLLYVALTTA